MDRNLSLGLLAALAAALIGSGWQIATRHGVTTTLGPMELAVLRYCVPALLLCPLLLRIEWRSLRSPWSLVLMVLCGGLPFGLLVLAGAKAAPAAHVGVFMAGAMPLFTALVCWLALGEQIRGLRWVGLAMVAAGVLTLGAFSLQAAHVGSWRGDLLFMAAAALWAVYTVAFRRSGLSPWQGAALVNAGSAVVLLCVLPMLGAPRLFTAPIGDVLFQLLWQGVIAGMLGLVTYTAAVTRLGAARASLSAALVPLMTAGGAALLLGEALGLPTLLAASLVAAGVALAALQGEKVAAARMEAR